MRTELAPIPCADGSVPPRPLPLIEVSGSGREAGRAYGEASRETIAHHLDVALARLAERRGLTHADATTRALAYRAATQAVHPDLAAEVDGVGEGAALEEGASWVLQLRAELQRDALGLECTSFAAFGPATRDGGVLAGQNADLPSMYQDLLVLVRRRGAGTPDLLTLTPAGQIGYHGMNGAGVAVFANFLTSGGWRVGVPRYLLTRVALAERSREAALAAVERTPRASPRNLVIADESGATDVELSAAASARIEAQRGLVAHTNHHVAPPMIPAERAEPDALRNSSTRLARLETLLGAAWGTMDVPTAARILRDRADRPDAISILPGEKTNDTATIASTIADIRERRLWIAIGPPHLAAYHPYQI